LSCWHSTIEFLTVGRTTWSAVQPAYDAATAITVRTRCINDNFSGCISAETVDATSSPEVCDTCLLVNCISQFGEFTIIKNEL